MTVAATASEPTPPRLARRLAPLQVGVALQGFMLWLPVEKLFMSQIGFTAASIGVLAASYSAVIPLLEVPSGIVADRWSRRWLMVASSAVLALSTLLGAVSRSVTTYVVAALVLGVFIAMGSGTVDSIVYDTVMEETGSSNLYERWIGRVRIIESASLAVSALAGGIVAGWTNPRFTYWISVPIGLASIVGFVVFTEPRLHRQSEPTPLRIHAAATFHVMARDGAVRRIMLVSAATGLLGQAVFEFGPLWLVALHAPPGLYGPYWAILVATIGVAGYAVSKVDLDQRPALLVLLGVLLVTGVTLPLASGTLAAVVVVQVILSLTVGMLGIHAGKLVHDAVASPVRAAVSSGVGTLSWLLFLPFSLVTGWVARESGVAVAAWFFTGAAGLAAALLTASVFGPGGRAGASTAAPVSGEGLEAAALDLEAVPSSTLAPPPVDLACRELVYLATDYLDGTLTRPWSQALEAHLSNCDGCGTYLQQFRQIIDEIRAADVLARPGKPVPAPSGLPHHSPDEMNLGPRGR